MTPSSREARARSLARGAGLKLVKNRSRDPEDLTYGGFMLIDPQSTAVVAGSEPVPYFLDLDDAESWLASP
jgi:hypothetical protein